MAAEYCTWDDVKGRYPLAEDVGSYDQSADQDALIQSQTNLFRSWIRNVHKEELTSPYDEIVVDAVAWLCAGFLERRVMVNPDQELQYVEFDHIRGAFTPGEIQAHTQIQAIKRGDAVLGQDVHKRDIGQPEVEIGSSNSGAGTIEAILPHEYKAHVKGVYKFVCTTTGRVDDGSAMFSVYFQNAETPFLTSVAATNTPTHIRNEFYVSFADASTDGSDSFEADDEFTITVFPPDVDHQRHGPRQINVFRA